MYMSYIMSIHTRPSSFLNLIIINYFSIRTKLTTQGAFGDMLQPFNSFYKGYHGNKSHVKDGTTGTIGINKMFTSVDQSHL